MAKLDSLLISLEVETAKLRSGLDAASGHLKKFGEDAKKMGEDLRALSENAAFEFGKELVKSLGEFVVKGAEAADQMGKLAQAAGTSVESFSRMAYAGKLTHVSTEDLSVAFNKLNKNLALAGAGGKDQAAIFSVMGVKVKDASGNLRASDEVMKDLAERFSGMQDGASKSALAMEVFGKSGAQLLPFLNEGREGLAKMAAESDKLGFTITGGAAKSAQEFVDNLDRLQLATTAVGTQVAANLSPALAALTNDLLNSKAGSDSMKGAVEGLTVVLKVLATGGVIIAALFDRVGKTLGATASIIVNILTGEFSSAVDDFNQLGHQMAENTQGAVNHIKEIWKDDPAGHAAEASAEKVKASGDKVLAALERQKKAAAAYGEAWKELTKVAQEYETKAATVGKSPLDVLIERMMNGDLSEKLAKLGKDASAMAGRIQKAFEDALAAEVAFEKHKLDFEAGRANTKLANEIGQRAQNFGNITSDAGEIFAQKTKGFEDFDAALEALAAHTRRQTELLTEAKLAEMKGDHAAAEAATLLADQAGEAAKRADQAATAFSDLAVDTKKTFDEAFAAIEAAAQAFQEKVLSNVGSVVQTGLGGLFSKLGASGQIANSALAGFQAAGIWGALIAVILELLSRFEGFSKVMDKSQASVNKALSDMAGGLGQLTDGLASLMDAIQPLKDLIHGILNPILKILGTLFKGIADTIGTLITILAPILSIVGDALSGVAGLLKDLFEPLHSIGDVLKPILKLFGDLGKVLVPLAPIFAIIGFVLQLVALVILAIMNAIGTIINAIAKAVGATSDVVDTTTMQAQMTNIATHLGDNFDPNGGKATNMQTGSAMPPGASGSTGGNGVTYAMSEAEWQASRQMNPGGPDTYQKYLESLPGYLKPLTSAVETTTNHFQKLNEAFTNLPSGYKLALARFGATKGVGSGSTSGVQMNGVTINITAPSNADPETFWKKLQQAIETRNFRANGSSQRWDPAHP